MMPLHQKIVMAIFALAVFVLVVELVRRKDQGEAFGMTFRLLTTNAGVKMGKTAGGAIWLDPAKTAPADFYQYWRNVDDADVISCLKLLTFLSLDEISGYAGLAGAAVNEAKKRLAYEVTAIVHGTEQADAARRLAEDLFERGGRSDDLSRTFVSRQALASGIPLLDLLLEAGLVPSKGEGRRLIQQGGIYLNDLPVADIARKVGPDDLPGGEAILRKGKKIYHSLAVQPDP